MVRALGIGANSAIFSLVSAVWLKSLPFTDAERLLGYVAQVATPRPAAARSR
jgi:hypothetical protein